MNRIMRKIVLWICLLVTSVLYAQETSLSVKLSQGHPRYLTDSNGKVETQKLIKEEPWAQEVFEKLKQRTDATGAGGPCRADQGLYLTVGTKPELSVHRNSSGYHPVPWYDTSRIFYR